MTRPLPTALPAAPPDPPAAAASPPDKPVQRQWFAMRSPPQPDHEDRCA